jgi:hypothetical protein
MGRTPDILNPLFPEPEAPQPTEEQLEELRRFIADRKWQFAKSMPFIPHEYTVKAWRLDDFASFRRFVELQREYGQEEQFGKRTFKYLYIDGWKYWTMGALIEETTVINRARPKKKDANTKDKA